MSTYKATFKKKFRPLKIYLYVANSTALLQIMNRNRNPEIIQKNESIPKTKS